MCLSPCCRDRTRAEEPWCGLQVSGHSHKNLKGSCAAWRSQCCVEEAVGTALKPLSFILWGSGAGPGLCRLSSPRSVPPDSATPQTFI